MGRNYLFFLIGLVVLLIFSFAFCWATIYMEQPLISILTFVGFIATLVISIVTSILNMRRFDPPPVEQVIVERRAPKIINPD